MQRKESGNSKLTGNQYIHKRWTITINLLMLWVMFVICPMAIHPGEVKVADPKKKQLTKPSKEDAVLDKYVKDSYDNWDKLTPSEQTKVVSVVKQKKPSQWNDTYIGVIDKYLDASTKVYSSTPTTPTNVATTISNQGTPPNVTSQISPNDTPSVSNQISPDDVASLQQKFLDTNTEKAKALDPAAGEKFDASASVTNSFTTRTPQATEWDIEANKYNAYQDYLQKQQVAAGYGDPNSDYEQAIARDEAKFRKLFPNSPNAVYRPGETYVLPSGVAWTAPIRNIPNYEKPLTVNSTNTGANTVSGSIGAGQAFEPKTGGYNPNNIGNDDIMVFKDVAGTSPGTAPLSDYGASFASNWSRNYADAVSGLTKVDANGNTTIPALKELPIKLADSIRQAAQASTKSGGFGLLDSAGKNIIEEKTKASMAGGNQNLNAFFCVDTINGGKLEVRNELLDKVRKMYVDNTNSAQQLPATDAIWNPNTRQWSKTISITPKELPKYLLEVSQWAGQSSVGKPGDASYDSVFGQVLKQDIIKRGKTGKPVLQQSREAAVNEIPYAITYLHLFGDEFAPNPSTLFKKR
jgi:hypothetical protein